MVTAYPGQFFFIRPDLSPWFYASCFFLGYAFHLIADSTTRAGLPRWATGRFFRILPGIKGPYDYYFRQDSVEKNADLFFLFFSFQHFLNPVFYDFSYQVIGNWCVQRKPDSPLRLFIRRQLFRERSDRWRSRVEPDVMVKRRKMHQVALEPEGGYPVPYCLLGLWCWFPDNPPEFFQQFPDIFGEFRDVLIDGGNLAFWWRHFPHHLHAGVP